MLNYSNIPDASFIALKTEKPWQLKDHIEKQTLIFR